MPAPGAVGFLQRSNAAANDRHPALHLPRACKPAGCYPPTSKPTPIQAAEERGRGPLGSTAMSQHSFLRRHVQLAGVPDTDRNRSRA